MAFGRQTIGIDKGRLSESDLLAVIIHHLDECFLRAADAFGQDDRGISPRLNRDPLDEIVDGDGIAERREHGGGAGRRTARPPGMLRNDELIVELDPPGLELAEYHRELKAGRIKLD